MIEMRLVNVMKEGIYSDFDNMIMDNRVILMKYLRNNGGSNFIITPTFRFWSKRW